MTGKEAYLTQIRLKELFEYDKGTGVFRWKISRGRARAGNRVGWDNGNGYLYITIERKNFYAHRLAWLYVHGEWPVDQIDHINRIKSDNRISNLRNSNYSENGINVGIKCTNTSGFTGVSWCNRDSKWFSSIRDNRRQVNLGRFKQLSDAVKARIDAESKYGYTEILHPGGEI